MDWKDNIVRLRGILWSCCFLIQSVLFYVRCGIKFRIRAEVRGRMVSCIRKMMRSSPCSFFFLCFTFSTNGINPLESCINNNDPEKFLLSFQTFRNVSEQKGKCVIDSAKVFALLSAIKLIKVASSSFNIRFLMNHFD